MRVTMENLDDHAGAIKDLRISGALKVAGLAWRDFMIDNHELRPWLPLQIRLDLAGVRILRVGVFKALARLRLPRSCHRSDDTGPAGYRREFRKPPLAQHRRAVDLVALLRYRAHELVTERLHQTAQLFEISGMRDVVYARELDAHKDGARNGRLGFHDAAFADSFLI